MATEGQSVLRFDNILVSSRGISEVDANHVVILVPSGEIEHITLRFGRAGHRPLLTIWIGLVLTLVGLLGLFEFVVSPKGFRYEFGMVVLGVIGGSLIFDAVKRRYFFEVGKKQDFSRLIFSRHARKGEIQDFCVQIRSAYKYDITDAT